MLGHHRAHGHLGAAPAVLAFSRQLASSSRQQQGARAGGETGSPARVPVHGSVQDCAPGLGVTMAPWSGTLTSWDVVLLAPLLPALPAPPDRAPSGDEAVSSAGDVMCAGRWLHGGAGRSRVPIALSAGVQEGAIALQKTPKLSEYLEASG